MGIRFHCPNGHRLNVKSYLAGKRGYCPDCGIKLVIPTESEPQLEHPRPQAETQPATPAATTAAKEPALQPQVQTQTAPPEPTQVDGRSAVWYVRPPSGGQFGPASLDVMNQWAAEQRIPPNSLIWREGWEDWKKATEVLATNGRLSPAEIENFDDVASLGLDDEAGVSGIDISRPATATTNRKDRHRRRRSRVAAILGFCVVVLIGVLLFIMQQR